MLRCVIPFSKANLRIPPPPLWRPLTAHYLASQSGFFSRPRGVVAGYLPPPESFQLTTSVTENPDIPYPPDDFSGGGGGMLGAGFLQQGWTIRSPSGILHPGKWSTQVVKIWKVFRDSWSTKICHLFPPKMPFENFSGLPVQPKWPDDNLAGCQPARLV